MTIILLLLAFALMKLTKENIAFTIPLVFCLFAEISLLYCFVAGDYGAGIRLVDAWIGAVTKFAFPAIDGKEIAAKNLFLLTNLFPLFAFVNHKKKFSNVIVAIIICAIVVAAASGNELTYIRPYFTSGLLFGAALIYGNEYRLNRKAFYFIGAFILAVGSCLTNRVGILMTVAWIVSFVMVTSCSYIYGNLKQKNISVFPLGTAIVMFSAVILYLYRISIIGDNSFNKDVFYTYLKGIFTSYRYSFVLPAGISYMCFLILSLLLYFAVFRGKETTDVRATSRLYLWNIILILVLGFLYMHSYARENMAKYGEYLTDFENYIQCPTVVMVYYYGYCIMHMISGRDKR